MAWTGNLFDALATFATWDDDLLCTKPSEQPVGGEFGTGGWDGIPDLTKFHSGFLNASDGFLVKQCYSTREDERRRSDVKRPDSVSVFAARYSARLLNKLSAHHADGGYGYSEARCTCPCLDVCPFFTTHMRALRPNVLSDRAPLVLRDHAWRRRPAVHCARAG